MYKIIQSPSSTVNAISFVQLQAATRSGDRKRLVLLTIHVVFLFEVHSGLGRVHIKVCSDIGAVKFIWQLIYENTKMAECQ